MDINVLAESKEAALGWASGKGHTETVKLLLEAGADVHAWGECALRTASYYGHTETVKLLEAHIKIV